MNKAFIQLYFDAYNNKNETIFDEIISSDYIQVVNVSDKGLVILPGCGHAGVINTINYAKKITGISRIYAIVGGFHLPADGGIYEGSN